MGTSNSATKAARPAGVPLFAAVLLVAIPATEEASASKRRIAMHTRGLSKIGGRIRRIVSLAAFAWIACSALPARADGLPQCVSTDAQLANALATAQFVPVTIEIVQGNYDLRNTILHDGLFTVSLQEGTELLGGYTSGCAGRDIAVGNTMLDDSNPTRRDNDGANLLGDFTVEGLTWSVAPSFAAGVDDHSLPANTTVLIRRDAFLDMHGPFSLSWWN